MQDILLIDKPAGITSFDVIRILRRKLKEENPSTSLRVKIGHAGTLDPMATGLLIVGVGEGTKKLKDYLKLPKVYEAEALLGLRTDTGDREGQVLEELSIINFQFSRERIKEVLRSMVGKLTLPVPRYSAIKVEGKRLYKRARAGEQFKPPEKGMEIKRITFKGTRSIEQGTSVQFEVEVSSGTYIRSLAEEFGRRLGAPATLWSLRRTKIGEFKVEDAEKL